MTKCKKHRYVPTYWEYCILNKLLDRYDYCLECGEEYDDKKRRKAN